MVAKAKQSASQKKGRVKVGKLETARELSAAEQKGVRSGDKASGKVQTHDIQILKITDNASPS